MAKKKLTAKQEMFVKEYLIDLNATQAAIRCGYSEKTAQEQSSRLLSNVMIKEAITKAKEKRAAKTDITAEWVLREAADVYREARDEGDRTNALKALDLTGKHVDIQAWKEKQEVSGELIHKIERVIIDK